MPTSSKRMSIKATKQSASAKTSSKSKKPQLKVIQGGKGHQKGPAPKTHPFAKFMGKSESTTSFRVHENTHVMRHQVPRKKVA